MWQQPLWTAYSLQLELCWSLKQDVAFEWDHLGGVGKVLLSWKSACVLPTGPELQHVSNTAASSRWAGQWWALQHPQDAELGYTGAPSAATSTDTFSPCVVFRSPCITCSPRSVCEPLHTSSVPAWKCPEQGLWQPEPLSSSCCFWEAGLREMSAIIHSWNNF